MADTDTAGARRQAIAAKTLREEITRHLQAGTPELQPYVRIAQAVLLALDEGGGQTPPALTGAQVRLEVFRIFVEHCGLDDDDETAATVLRFAQLIETGTDPGAPGKDETEADDR